MNKYYKIIGKYQGQSEEIDVANSKEEAEYMLQEYKQAYGPAWKIWAEPAKSKF
jgi:hypothetical protein